MFYMTPDSLPTLCWQQSRQGALNSKARCCSIKKKAHTIPYKQAPDDNGTEKRPFKRKRAQGGRVKKRSEHPVKTLSRVTLPSAAMSFIKKFYA